MGIKVYEYGLLQPTLNGERAHDQLRRAHRYYNKLIEIERKRRTEWRALASTVADVFLLESEIEALASELVSVREMIKSIRKAARQTVRTSETRALNDRAQTISEMIKPKRAALAEAKRQLREDPILAEKIAEIDARASEAVKAARDPEQSGLYWGTYLLIEQDAGAAKKARIDPRFKRWDGEGVLGVQLQGGMPVSEIFGDDTRIRIASVSEEAWTHPTRGERRRLSRTKLMFRVGSDDHKRPIWAEWPMVMHRALPEGGVIKWAKVVARKHAHWTRWFLQLTVEVPPSQPGPRPQIGRVAINLGWRELGAELRAATAVGDDGVSFEVRIPEKVIKRIRKAEAIRSARDQHTDRFREDLITMLDGLSLPDAVREAASHVAQWRSPGRFVRLLDVCRKNRFDGDDNLIGALDTWRRRDLHLWQYEQGTRRHAIGHRREIFRTFAAKLSQRYSEIVLGEHDLAEMAQKPDPEHGTKKTTVPDSNRTIAGVSILRSCLEHAFTGRGGAVRRLGKDDITQRCHACGDATPWDAAVKVEHECVACGATWDQDTNACRNLLASAEAAAKDPESLAPEKPSGDARRARWHKRHRPAAQAIDG